MLSGSFSPRCITKLGKDSNLEVHISLETGRLDSPHQLLFSHNKLYFFFGEKFVAERDRSREQLVAFRSVLHTLRFFFPPLPFSVMVQTAFRTCRCRVNLQPCYIISHLVSSPPSHFLLTTLVFFTPILMIMPPNVKLDSKVCRSRTPAPLAAYRVLAVFAALINLYAN